MKKVLTYEDIYSILKNNPKNKWRELLENYVDNEAIKEWSNIWNGLNAITHFYGETSGVTFTFDEAEAGTFPFEVGDIVTHINYPGSKFIIYDYPWLDDRMWYDKEKYPNVDVIQNIINFGNNYCIDGILSNGVEAGLERSSPALFMSSIECHWSYLTKIGNVSGLSEDDPLYKIYQQCLEWYPHFVYHIKK